jgi:hypothetical protein
MPIGGWERSPTHLMGRRVSSAHGRPTSWYMASTSWLTGVCTRGGAADDEAPGLAAEGPGEA